MLRYLVVGLMLLVCIVPIMADELGEISEGLELALKTLVEGQDELSEGLRLLEEGMNEVVMGLKESEQGLSEMQRALTDSKARLLLLENTVKLWEADQKRQVFWRWIERAGFAAVIAVILIWK